MMEDKSENMNTVCIVGRPNVGKSSLFNRIIGMRRAIVYQESGTTRDRLFCRMEWMRARFSLIDTGGFMPKTQDRISELVKKQIHQAIDESTAIIFVCDVTSGILPFDEELAVLLRKSNKRIFLAINKVDNEKLVDNVNDFYNLSMGKPYPVSALHNKGIGELLDSLVEYIGPSSGEDKDEGNFIRIAILGRPNVGKSSYFNSLINQERVIVDEVPGTTRDSIDIYFKHNDTEFIIIDTAGIRHKRKIKEAVDVYGILRAKETMSRSDAVIVLIDGYDGLRKDDMKILDMISREGKGCVLVVNKWDLVKNVPMETYKKALLNRAVFLRDFPIAFVSCLVKRNVLQPIELIKKVIENSRRRISIKKLEALNAELRRIRLPCGKRGSLVKFNHIAQIGITPPRFLVFINDARLASEEFDNFLKRELRLRFDFFGVPIVIEYRTK